MLDNGMGLLSESPWVGRASSYGIIVGSVTASLRLAGPVWPKIQSLDYTASTSRTSNSEILGLGMKPEA